MLTLSISAHDPLRTIRHAPGCVDQPIQPLVRRTAANDMQLSMGANVYPMG